MIFLLNRFILYVFLIWMGKQTKIFTQTNKNSLVLQTKFWPSLRFYKLCDFSFSRTEGWAGPAGLGEWVRLASMYTSCSPAAPPASPPAATTFRAKVMIFGHSSLNTKIQQKSIYFSDWMAFCSSCDATYRLHTGCCRISIR